MQQMDRRVAGLAAALALLTGAQAPAPPDPEGTVVQELVVQAREPGPAWWKVASPTAAVWVLGVPSALPKGQGWDQQGLERRLARARRVILPPAAHIGLLDLIGALSLAGKMRLKAPFEASLPPDLARRFTAAVAALKRPADRYDRWKPAIAGVLMTLDFRQGARLDADQPVAAIRGLAQRHGVAVAPAASYAAMPFAKMFVAELSDQVNAACLADALDEVEAGAGRTRAAADAWARGDVAGALTAERGFERCAAALPNGADLVRQSEADQTHALEGALKTPGETVAVVDLRPLLAKGGVLDQLRAAGYQVSGG
ncbi:MAG TPA: TraB/GumN family protein [Caulobacteraceae bacterium]|jgi:hypothetical protein